MVNYFLLTFFSIDEGVLRTKEGGTQNDNSNSVISSAVPMPFIGTVYDLVEESKPVLRVTRFVGLLRSLLLTVKKISQMDV
mgnify:CR=1 FL=1